MVQLALERVSADDTKRRAELVTLQVQISEDMERRRHIASQSFYHFGKLPLEVAVEMFSLALAQDHAQVVVLAQVCKNWRTAILNTSAFWGTLVLTDRHPLKKMKVWRERSEGRLVELCLRRELCATAISPGSDDMRAIPMASIRILRIGRGFPYHWVNLYIRSLKEEVWRNLHELELSDCLSLSPLLWSQPEMQLRRLTFSNVSPLWNTSTTCLRRLEQLVYQGPLQKQELLDLLILLQENLSLQKLVLRIFDSLLASQSLIELPSDLQFPSLTELEISDYSSIFITHLFPTFSLSSLRSFTLSRVTTIDIFLRHLLNRGYASNLVEFRAHLSALTATTVVAFLHEAKALKTLELTHIGGSQLNTVLEALATPVSLSPPLVEDNSARATTSPQVLCPALRHVDFSHCPDIRSGPLVRLVKLRLPPAASSPDDALGDLGAEAGLSNTETTQVAPIETLIVDSCPTVEADILPWLRSKVPVVSCVYLTKKQAAWKR